MRRFLLGLLLLGGCLPELEEPILASRPDHDFDGDGVTEDDGDCDDEDASATSERAWFPDGDQDGYGAGTATVACQAPEGHAADGGDCRDTDPSVHPGADERCNDLDDDCDAAVDEDPIDPVAWYLDADGDGHGDPDAMVMACDAPADHVSTGDDCDDDAVAVHPGAEEPDCTDPIDYDCDGSTGQDDLDEDGVVACDDCDDADPDVTVPTWYADGDGDGFGDGGVPLDACEAPDGYVADATDCNDAHDAVFPGSTEACNGVDDDCDDLVDDDDPDVTGLGTWFVDGDFDGYGSPDSTIDACEAPSGYAATDDDCDDADDAIHPNAAETDCADPVDYNCDGATGYSDGDGDGVAACEDCDDADPAVLPGGTESCNGKDDDCNGTVDDGVGLTFYQDSDKDGYGNAAVTRIACTAPSGYVADATDCDDTRATVNPAGAETCNTRDDDCDGTVDEGVKSTFYADSDGDGYGDSSLTQEACTAPSGHVADATDCDDTRGVVNPGAAEVCDGLDNDCDTLADDDDDDVTGTSVQYVDADDDGYGDGATTAAACETPIGYAANDDDCNDSNAAIHPGAPETDCTDPTDYNCDGLVGAVDGDGDGTYACEDCNDANPAIFPGATEVCNGADDDCEGGVDEGVTTTYWRDLDGDGYGNPASTTQACSRPTGYATNDDDCNDSSGSISPSASEVCNAVDDDCDGTVDDGVLNTYYADSDGDGYGNPTSTKTGCSAPSGFVADKRDCNDADPNVNPGKAEVCNGKDDDCDTFVDEGVLKTFFRDADGDGYGTSATTVTGCTAPSGYVSSSTDCNDADPLINPGRSEVCNGKDDDCDTLTDEGVLKTYYLDSDNDYWAVSTASTTGCTKPTGYALLLGDCDDSDPAINPDATEVCDDADTDENCNGTADDADWTVDSSTMTSWYPDADGDGYGDPKGTVSLACDGSTAEADNADDCDDSNATRYPGNYCFVGGTTTLEAGKGYELVGESAGDRLGAALAGGGDCNSDGAKDLLVGSPGYDASDKGRGYLATIAPTGSTVVSTASTATFTGVRSSDQLGSTFAWLPDVNADSTPELVIASPFADASTTSLDHGFVAIQRCPAAGSYLTSYTARFYGGTAGDRAGAAVTAVGSYLAIGAPLAKYGAADAAGTVYLVSGSATTGSSTISLSSTATGVVATRFGATRDERAGEALGSGDIDGDGTPELFVGAPGMDAGSAGVSGGMYIVWGPVSGSKVLTVDDKAFYGVTDADETGTVIATGDVDGDGAVDVAVTAAAIDTVYVASGQTLYYYSSFGTSEGVITGVTGSGFGASLAFVDHDNDDIDELVVGAPKADVGTLADAGTVSLFLSPMSYLDASDADATWQGDAANAHAGASVTGIDWDGDDWEDLVIGAPGRGNGTAFVLWGYAF